jgi:hypothetical protein
MFDGLICHLKTQPRFETISVFADFVAAYTPIVLLVIAWTSYSGDSQISDKLSRKAA